MVADHLLLLPEVMETPMLLLALLIQGMLEATVVTQMLQPVQVTNDSF
ncbi:Uncharacterised protein [Mycobacterium tuberculosis]|nr:Uncharacterised protein [Mycobacterium tuberculosis]CKV79266.1 Uncharacterised protein [Mycobacterium tuberculosis]